MRALYPKHETRKLSFLFNTGTYVQGAEPYAEEGV